MADSMVIVNFEALEGAIQAFTAASGRISSIASDVVANANRIDAAIESEAASSYVGKQAGLGAQVEVAQAALQRKVQVLQELLDGAISAEQAAERIAAGVSDSASSSSFEMQ